jgi:hypothetical protein
MRQNHLFFMFMQIFYLQIISSATKQREIFFCSGPMIVVGQDFFDPKDERQLTTRNSQDRA